MQFVFELVDHVPGAGTYASGSYPPCKVVPRGVVGAHIAAYGIGADCHGAVEWPGIAGIVESREGERFTGACAASVSIAVEADAGTECYLHDRGFRVGGCAKCPHGLCNHRDENIEPRGGCESYREDAHTSPGGKQCMFHGKGGMDVNVYVSWVLSHVTDTLYHKIEILQRPRDQEFAIGWLICEARGGRASALHPEPASEGITF